jgi:thioredoxin-like negative regulator of GroEL
MNLDSFNGIIQSKKAVMIYFSSEDCGVCHALKPKITQAFAEYYPQINQIELKIEINLELARSLNLFAIPSVLVFFESKEFIRKERYISINHFINEVKRPYDILFYE